MWPRAGFLISNLRNISSTFVQFGGLLTKGRSINDTRVISYGCSGESSLRSDGHRIRIRRGRVAVTGEGIFGGQELSALPGRSMASRWNLGRRSTESTEGRGLDMAHCS